MMIDDFPPCLLDFAHRYEAGGNIIWAAEITGPGMYTFLLGRTWKRFTSTKENLSLCNIFHLATWTIIRALSTNTGMSKSVSCKLSKNPEKSKNTKNDTWKASLLQTWTQWHTLTPHYAATEKVQWVVFSAQDVRGFWWESNFPMQPPKKKIGD